MLAFPPHFLSLSTQLCYSFGIPISSVFLKYGNTCLSGYSLCLPVNCYCHRLACPLSMLLCVLQCQGMSAVVSAAEVKIRQFFFLCRKLSKEAKILDTSKIKHSLDSDPNSMQLKLSYCMAVLHMFICSL